MNTQQYNSVCNDTKWRELRNFIISLDSDHWPKFRSKCLSNGYVSPWDGEWFYHFSEGGFKDIEWFELRWDQNMSQDTPHGILKIGLTGERVDDALRIYGYVANGSVQKKLNLVEFGTTDKADITAGLSNDR